MDILYKQGQVSINDAWFLLSYFWCTKRTFVHAPNTRNVSNNVEKAQNFCRTYCYTFSLWLCKKSSCQILVVLCVWLLILHVSYSHVLMVVEKKGYLCYVKKLRWKNTNRNTEQNYTFGTFYFNIHPADNIDLFTF